MLKEQKLLSLFPDAVDKIKTTVVCQKDTYETRNKAKLAVSWVDNEIQFGFYDQGIQFKKLEFCPLLANPINEVLLLVKKLLSEYQIIPYNVKTKKGELKYLLITFSKSSNQLMLRFVLRSKESLDRLKKVANQLVIYSQLIEVVTANIQSVHQAILEGEEEIVLTENDNITHYFDDFELFQGPRSFFQTNSEMAQYLYRQFQTELSYFKVDALLDLYCGVGAFSLYASKSCQKVVGVEISSSAINYANRAKDLKNINHLNFYAEDVEKFLAQNHEYFDAVVVNPPRRGLNEKIIEQVLLMTPNYIFYSSCNYETLKRDLVALDKLYYIKSMQIFDMFPFTNHFETLVVLIKN
jgi:23S rRNA (uracil747-C5)-methyltransferase